MIASPYIPYTSSTGLLNRARRLKYYRGTKPNASKAPPALHSIKDPSFSFWSEIQLGAAAKAQTANIYTFNAAFPITHLAAGRGKQTQADDKAKLTVLLSKRCLGEHSWRRVFGQALSCRHWS